MEGNWLRGLRVQPHPLSQKKEWSLKLLMWSWAMATMFWWLPWIALHSRNRYINQVTFWIPSRTKQWGWLCVGEGFWWLGSTWEWAELCERQLGGEREIENQKTKETSIPKQMNWKVKLVWRKGSTKSASKISSSGSGRWSLERESLSVECEAFLPVGGRSGC